MLQLILLRINLRLTQKIVRLVLTLTLAGLFLSTALFGKNVNAYPLSMPKEYIDYVITRVDNVLWAKIDGTYPIDYAGDEESIFMVYPTPPGTSNISLWLNDAPLSWSNFTEVYPEETHHTVIGDWAMISTVLEPVSSHFVLRIHYEHPVQVINGSYGFLYDLNISPYLSISENKSVAHFTIHMEIEYADFEVNTVFGQEETLKPIAFTVSAENPAEITIEEVSEFDKPLPGDLLVSFSEANTQENGNFLAFATVLFAVSIAAVLAVFSLLRRRRKRENS
jgi:hypothetical protein